MSSDILPFFTFTYPNGIPNKKLTREEIVQLNKELIPKKLKFCNGCTQVLSTAKFGKNKAKLYGLRNKCNFCRRSTRSNFRKKNNSNFIKYEHTKKYKERQFIGVLRRMYGITLEEFNNMKNRQNNKCAICKNEEKHITKTKLSIDHCHSTGIVRGLLCHRCNVILGLAKEDVAILENAIKYLKGELK